MAHAKALDCKCTSIGAAFDLAVWLCRKKTTNVMVRLVEWHCWITRWCVPPSTWLPSALHYIHSTHPLPPSLSLKLSPKTVNIACKCNLLVCLTQLHLPSCDLGATRGYLSRRTTHESLNFNTTRNAQFYETPGPRDSFNLGKWVRIYPKEKKSQNNGETNNDNRRRRRRRMEHHTVLFIA